MASYNIAVTEVVYGHTQADVDVCDGLRSDYSYGRYSQTYHYARQERYERPVVTPTPARCVLTSNGGPLSHFLICLALRLWHATVDRTGSYR